MKFKDLKYIILDGKKPTHKFKDGKGAKTFEEVEEFDNYAVIVPDGYVVLDFDTTSDADIMRRIVDTLDLKTLVFETTRGIHCWFKAPEDHPKNFIKNRLAVGIYCDRKAGGRNAYVKIKQDGKKRNILKRVNLDDLDILPKWLTSVASSSDKFNFKGMGNGSGRNQGLYDYILYLQGKGFSRDEIRETIDIINRFVFADPLPESEIATITRDESFKPEDEITGSEKRGGFNHIEIAEEIIEKHRLIRYNNVLYEYLDNYYQPAENVRKYVRDTYRGAKNNQVNEVVSYISDMREIRSGSIKFNPYILNLENTRLNMKTGERLPFTPGIIEFDRIPVKYDPSARCEDLDKMLKRVFMDDSDTMDLFDEMLGYTLTKASNFETGFILFGGGSNGKSTVLDLIKTFLGSRNYTSIPLDTLSKRFSTAELEHKLANIGDDINDTPIKDNGTIKQLISGKSILVERKGERPFNMVPYATQIFSCNEIPKSFDNSDGFMRRWIYIPFNARFTPEDPDYDPFIKDKITSDEALSYLLNKAIDGLHRLLKNKRFTEPLSSRILKDKYRKENSSVLSWIEEEKIDLDFVLKIQPKEIYARFSDWCKSSNIKDIPGKTHFYREIMREFSLDEKRRKSKGAEYFRPAL